jgi:hypothetical protein
MTRCGGGCCAALVRYGDRNTSEGGATMAFLKDIFAAELAREATETQRQVEEARLLLQRVLHAMPIATTETRLLRRDILAWLRR